MSKVTSIVVGPSLCPLVDAIHKLRACYFSAKVQTLWSSDQSDRVVPVTLSPNTSVLKVSVQMPGNYEVSAMLGTQNIIASGLVTFTNEPYEFPLIIPGNKVPYSFRGSVEWKLFDPASKKTEISSTSVEIYVLTPSLPKYFDNPGIPLALLRLDTLMPKWQQSDKTDWATFVVSQLHNETRLEYDTWKGVSKYTSSLAELEENSSSGIEIKACWLDLWLSDMEGLRLRNDTKSKYGVNCYDTAALAQVIISIGLPNIDFRMNYMEPVGFIRDTLLIGYTTPPVLCNNPYFGTPGAPRDMHCDPTAANRTKVENHMFLTLCTKPVPVILDACCGPETGNTTILQYPGSIIDTTVPEGEAEARTGTLACIFDGPGVRELAASAFFDTDSAGWLGENTLLQKLTMYLASMGEVQKPYIGRLPDSDVPSATITFNPGGDDIWTINIFRFKEGDEARVEYQNRKMEIRDPEDLNANTLINVHCRGGFTMFYDSETCILSIIESRIAKSEKLGELRNAMTEIIKDVDKDQEPVVKDWTNIDSIIQLGEEFTIIITVSTLLSLPPDSSPY